MKRLLIFSILFLSIPLLYLVYLFLPTSLSSEKVRFVVPLEAKPDEIINRLKKENFIRSPSLFNFLSSLIKYPGAIEPGAYQLSHNMTAWQIADTLLNHPYQKWIILVPGLRVEQIAEKLKSKFNWDEAKSKEFLENTKEGYLFPDTYLLNIDYTGKDFAQKLINNFNEKFDTKLQADLLTQDVRNDTAIKIASLIESESGGDEDKALIAGVIWNRLEKGMRLEIDATIQYALGKPGDWWPIVQGKKLREVESSYNTYVIKGLPPAPICNPSLASIKAAVYPLETDCFYYLHSPNKQIHCSKTYEEHLKNIEEYLK